MLTEEQIAKIVEAAKGEDPGGKLAEILTPITQAAADAIIAEQVKGLKKNRDEFKTDLDRYKPLGKPEELQAALDELETLRKAPKGKAVDSKELEAMAAERAEKRVEAFRQEQEALRKSIEEERNTAQARADRAVERLGTMHRRMLISQLAPDVRPLMRPYYEQRLGAMLEPVENGNGEDVPWWDADVVQFRVIDPEHKTPLSGPSGNLTAKELIEQGRQGFGEKGWNSADFRDTFFEAKGKGGGGITATRVPGPKPGVVDPSAPSHQHFGALLGTSSK